MSLQTATSVVRSDQWPIGLKYKPSKDEFVGILKKKIAGEEIRYEKIVVLDSGDLYSNIPDVLFKDKNFSYKDRFVVVANRKPNGKGGFNRQLPSQFNASWDPCSELKAILAKDEDTFIGVYQLFHFCYGKVTDPCGKMQTQWYMKEIQILEPAECPLAICIVYEVPHPQVLAALKAQKSAHKAVRLAKKRICIADYQAKAAAKLAGVDHGLEAAEKTLKDARKIAGDVLKKHKIQEDQFTLTSMLSAGKKKMACEGPSNQQPPSATPATIKRKIKLRVICSRSQPSEAAKEDDPPADMDQENV